MAATAESGAWRRLLAAVIVVVGVATPATSASGGAGGSATSAAPRHPSTPAIIDLPAPQPHLRGDAIDRGVVLVRYRDAATGAGQRVAAPAGLANATRQPVGGTDFE